MNIIQVGDPCLTQKCEPFFESLAPELIAQMRETMEKNNGIGLAANQVGISKSFFMAYIEGVFGVFVNPVIRNHGQEHSENPEGCLSILDAHGKCIYKPKKRWKVIDVSYLDENQKEHRRTLKRLSARIFQHELDHLNGKLCQDLGKAPEEEVR